MHLSISHRRRSFASLPVILCALIGMVGALTTNFGVAVSDVSALPNAIFSENFNSVTQTNLLEQANTGLSVSYADVLDGWTAEGNQAIHDVDTDNTSGKNIAAAFYRDNAIILNTGFAANTAGVTYTVTFEVGPTVSSEASQASNASDGLVVDVFRFDNTILFSDTQLAGAWTGTPSSQTLTSRKFSYVGDGSGLVRLKISTIDREADRFGGAIDNIRVDQSPSACDPFSSTSGGSTLLQFTMVGTCSWTVPAGVSNVEALLVGGGGGGGSDVGGGGGGGQVVSTTVTVSGVVPIVVGAGGVYGWNRMYNDTASGKTGGKSSIGNSVSALGGSGGNGRFSNNLNRDGTANNTGFTGGGGPYQDCDECRLGTTGLGGVLYKGGNGTGNGGGGGGGAGGAGADRVDGELPTAAGGIGIASSLSGTSVTYGGGGGGGGYPDNVLGGQGIAGGGNGVSAYNQFGKSGVNGLGGGGGGASSDGSTWGHGGMGGSGIVIIKFTTPAPTTSSTTEPVTTTLPATIATTPPVTTTTVKAAVTIDIQAPVTTVAQGQVSVATIAPGAAQAPASPMTTVAVSNQSTTTTSLAPVQQSLVTLAPPKIPAVRTGESALDLGGVQEKVDITRENNQVVIKSGALSARLSGLGKNGATSPLDKDGNLQLEPGDIIRINVGGFRPGSDVDVWFFSTPTHLGSTKVGADGTVSGAFTVPAKIEDGSHRIAITAKLENGKQATFTLGVRVGAIPKTSTLTRILIAIPIMMAIGAGLILPNQIRRRRQRA